MPSFRAAALTDIGRVRRENEDRFIFDENYLLFGVADGVGGLPGGAEAAQVAVDDVIAQVKASSPTESADLVSALHHANDAVAAMGQKISPTMGIGTTLTAGYIRKNVFTIAHVGDSRCYAISKGEFTRVTEDHSVENEARLRRAKGEVVYYHEANRNALTRCLGQPTWPEVDIIHRDLTAGSRYLFCTDGVTRMVLDSELNTLLRKFEDPKAALEEIVSLAVRRGGPDNATGVMVYIDSL